MRLALRVDLGSGPVDVLVSPLAIIGWERDNRTKISALAQDGIGMSDMADLAWRQLKAQGKYEGDFEQFAAALVDLDPVAEVDPT